MPKAGRLGDIGSGHGCFPPTPIIAGSGDTFINGKPAARKDDAVLLHGCPCPKTPHGIHGRAIAAGSCNVSINGKPAARIGDAINCGGSVSTGSPDTFIGEIPYKSPSSKCAEAAAKKAAPLMILDPMPQPAEMLWGASDFFELNKKDIKEEKKQVIPASINKEEKSLADKIISEVSQGARPERMLEILNTNTTKAMRRKARKEIADKKKETDPETSQRFKMDMDAAEKAQLSANVYNKEDMPKDSGWREASSADLNRLGLTKNDLKFNDDPDFRVKVYMPDKEVFGPEAKPVIAFKGTSPLSKENWKNNIQQGLDKDSRYYKRVALIADKIDGNVEATGHSLGGGMASLFAKITGNKTTTYNAAGLHKNSVTRYAGNIKLADDNVVTGYRVKGEILTHMQEDLFLTKGIMPDAARNKSLDTTLPAPINPRLIGAAGGTIGGLLGHMVGNVGTRVYLHTMSPMISSIEKRKINDLHCLSKGSS